MGLTNSQVNIDNYTCFTYYSIADDKKGCLGKF
jgi:hypothetical protein